MGITRAISWLGRIAARFDFKHIALRPHGNAGASRTPQPGRGNKFFQGSCILAGHSRRGVLTRSVAPPRSSRKERLQPAQGYAYGEHRQPRPKARRARALRPTGIGSTTGNLFLRITT